MATAILENHNKYSYLGLRRRPTYNEIINLIGENETLTGTLPDRTATQFKQSQEGSFFDGLDHLEILKEEQNRIQERQLRELMLRRNLGGRTYHAERFRQQVGENTPPQPETPNNEDDGMTNAQMQTELERRATDYANRQQQTGQAHQTLLERATSMPIIRGLMPLVQRGTQSVGGTPQHRNVPHVDLTQDDDVETEPEMLTARTDMPNDHIADTLFFTNQDASEEELQRAYSVLLQYKHVSPEVMSQNFMALNNIYNTLLETGFITQSVWQSYQKKTKELAEHTQRNKQNKVREDIVDNYKINIYDKFINPATSSGS